MGEIFRRERSPKPLPFTGERYTSAMSGQIEIEHTHRYLVARDLCHGKDVLDVSCGEGYGSALISQVARFVTGLDLDPNSVNHAQKAYARANLNFSVGDARQLPLADQSVDTVVSFETLEHFSEHDVFLSEVKRVLRPGGTLIFSTPERDVYSPPGKAANPFHVHELSSPELFAVLARHFKHIRLLGQRPLLGSAIVSAPSDDAPGPVTTFERRGEDHFERSTGLPRPLYCVAIASDQRSKLPIPESIFIETSLVNETQNVLRIELVAARREITESAALQTELVAIRGNLAAKNELFQQDRQSAEAERIRAASVRADLADGLARETTLQTDLARLQRSLAEGRARETALQAEVQRLDAELRRVRSSRSWWITAPARKLWRVIRRFGRGLFPQPTTRRQSDSVKSWSEAKALVAASGAFDPSWYRARNLDVFGAFSDPLDHYLELGWKQGRRPNAMFDPAWYLAQDPAIAAAGLEPLTHYLTEGSREGRQPCPHLDPAWYRAMNPDVAADGMDPLAHFLQFGAAEGRKPSPDWDNHTRERRARAFGLSLTLRPTKVTIGVVTYNNRKAELSRCLRSAKSALQRIDGLDTGEILVIDNGDPSHSTVSGDLPGRWLESQGNVGFGRAHNIMMTEAFGGGADYYLALNPDGALDPHALEALIRMAEAASGHSVVEALQFPEEHPKAYDVLEFDTPWASGACLLIPRAIYEAIGGFDESFFMYCEDVDFSWRARAAGFGVKICPRALFFHPVGSRTFDPAAHQRLLASGIVLARKWGSADFERTMTEALLASGASPPSLADVETIGSPGWVCDFEHGFHFSKVRWQP